MSKPQYRGNWPALRLYVLARDNWQCQIKLPGCKQQATEADHITPITNGGTHTPDNLRAACKSCNATLGAQLANNKRWHKPKPSRQW